MELFGFFAGLPVGVTASAILAVLFVLGYTGAPLALWTLAGAAALAGFAAPVWLWTVYGVLAAVFNLSFLRRPLLSAPIVQTMKALKFLPQISQTEQEAIDAGNIWIDGELFSGKPDFERMINEEYPDLSAEERAFLDGPVEELCQVTSDWDVWQNRKLPQEAWDIIKRDKFFGLIIPKKYGGHEFSPSANSAIVSKLSSRSGPLSTTVMVPNSLGPAELLMHYGTDKQKDYYLPRLATAEEIPCFALTEPGAGSDAGAMTSRGVIFKGEDGELYMRLTWKKRYITLAAISTVLGLAFKLYDPDKLLGKDEALGITCALIPTDTAGVVIGKRHDPLGIPFYNCPTEGHDVVVPISAIIGGPEMAGKGWRMLMESLSVGRGISLPASAAGGTQMITRGIGAYARLRKQFGLPIGKFEGIEEPLARIGGYTYILEAARRYTCGALDGGEKPPVITAMAKYNFTELGRKAINDAMDVAGGSGISRGPRNLLAHPYMNTPVGITVEGANILTRTLMIFGQGAIRCHPYALKEIEALGNNDLKAFDAAFWAHIGHVVRNLFRSIGLSVTRGYLASSPVSGPAARYWRKLAWSSASFALLADIAMGRFGGNLKRMEKITGRYADIFSWMYLGAAVLRRYEAEGRRKEDLALMEWSMEHAFAEIQQAFDGLLSNLGFPFTGPIAWWSRLNSIGRKPSDALGSKVARIIQQPGEQRDRLTPLCYQPEDPQEALGRLNLGLALAAQSEPVVKKVMAAMKSGKLKRDRIDLMVVAAVKDGIITKDEAELLARAEEIRTDVIQVDSFTQDEYMRTAAKDVTDNKPEPERAKAV